MFIWDSAGGWTAGLGMGSVGVCSGTSHNQVSGNRLGQQVSEASLLQLSCLQNTPLALVTHQNIVQRLPISILH